MVARVLKKVAPRGYVGAAAQRRTAGQFTAAHPLVPVTEVPAQAEDVHDLDGLRAIGEAFGAGKPADAA